MLMDTQLYNVVTQGEGLPQIKSNEYLIKWLCEKHIFTTIKATATKIGRNVICPKGLPLIKLNVSLVT